MNFPDERITEGLVKRSLPGCCPGEANEVEMGWGPRTRICKQVAQLTHIPGEVWETLDKWFLRAHPPLTFCSSVHNWFVSGDSK